MFKDDLLCDDGADLVCLPNLMDIQHVWVILYRYTQIMTIVKNREEAKKALETPSISKRLAWHDSLKFAHS